MILIKNFIKKTSLYRNGLKLLHNQLKLFYSLFPDMLNMNDPLITLANTINWNISEEEFKSI
jgi:hypothetical protein